MKKILSLQQLIELQSTIESMINDAQVKIISNNAWLKRSKAEKIDTVALYQQYDSLLEQLNIVKLAKDKANRRRTKFGGVTNQQLIFDLSNLNRKRSLLETLTISKLKNRKGSEVDAYEFQISKSEIANKLIDVENRISEIKKTMTNFNTSTTVKIVVFEELNLL